MKDIALVIDSTADLTKDLIHEYDIKVIPLSIVHGNQIYRDGIDIQSDEFYELLANTDVLPKSSQPSPQDFIDLYKELLQDYKEIISLHLSSGLSGTINAADQARKAFDDRVKVFDSQTISLGIGLQALETAKKIKMGWNSEDIVQHLHKIKHNVETLFTLDTLEYLHKGGRIGKVSSLMGSLLNIKPIIRVEDGIYVPYGKARSQQSALQKIITAYENFAQDRKPVQLAVAHGAGEKAATFLQEALENTLGVEASIFTQVGPVIGVHTGPGTVGAAVLFDDE